MASKADVSPGIASSESNPPDATSKLTMPASAACDTDGKVDIDHQDDHLIYTKELEQTVNIIEGKGEFLGGGTTGLVERLPSGDAIKSPWTGRPTAADCRQEMAIEARIYERLGAHPRLVPLKHWDPVECTLTLEYMPHGNLRDYVENHGQDISTAQRRKWAVEAAEGVALLHAHGVLQGDVGPHNFLLDADLALRICDFGGSSLDGSRATVAPGVRYRLPSLGGRRHVQQAMVKEDLFGLGSTVYFIAAGHAPYGELDDEDEVERLYGEGVFPDLGGVLFAEAIALCWKGEVESARAVVEILGRS